MYGKVFAAAQLSGLASLGQVTEGQLTDDQMVVFSLQVIVLLLMAIVFGWASKKLGWPQLVGEICAGVLLGPYVLGYLWPGGFQVLIPGGHSPGILLEGGTKLGILYLLFAAGFELNPGQVFAHARAALSIGVIGMVLPFVVGIFLTLGYCYTFDYQPPCSQLHFVLFVSLVMSISAMVIAVRLLDGLGIRAFPVGQAIVCGYAVDDVLAWVFFSCIFNLAISGTMPWVEASLKLLATLAFAGVCLRFGPKLTNPLLSLVRRRATERGVFVAVLLFALAMGAFTHQAGVTQYFGVFLAGVLVSECEAFTQRVRHWVTAISQNVLVPLYFVLIGISLEIHSGLSWSLILYMALVSVALKYLGAYFGAMCSGRPRSEWNSIGMAFIPGGMMGIIVSEVAMQHHLIDGPVKVAIVISAVFSSIIAGPCLKRAVRDIRAKSPVRIADFLGTDKMAIAQVYNNNRAAVLNQLCSRAAQVQGIPHGQEAFLQQLKQSPELRRVESMFGPGFAYIHIRCDLIERHVVRIGWSAERIPWSDDGSHWARIFVFVVVPGEVKTKGTNIKQTATSNRMADDVDDITVVLGRTIARMVDVLSAEKIHEAEVLSDNREAAWQQAHETILRAIQTVDQEALVS